MTTALHLFQSTSRRLRLEFCWPLRRLTGASVVFIALTMVTSLGNAKAMPTEAASRWSFGSIAGYSVRSDLAQTRDPQLSSHRITAGASVTLADHPVSKGFEEDLVEEIATFSVAAAGQFLTLGQEIESNRNGTFELADVDLSLSHSAELKPLLKAKNMVELSLGATVPTSVASQFEGVQSVPYAASTWLLSFRGGLLTLNQGLSADYTANTFRFSPTTKEINSDTSVGYTLGASFRLGSGLKFSIGGNARLIHHLDDTVTDALSNTQTLSWSRQNYTIMLRHSNGSRAEDRETDLWFIDRYRNVLSLSAMARF